MSPQGARLGRYNSTLVCDLWELLIQSLSRQNRFHHAFSNERIFKFQFHYPYAFFGVVHPLHLDPVKIPLRSNKVGASSVHTAEQHSAAVEILLVYCRFGSVL